MKEGENQREREQRLKISKFLSEHESHSSDFNQNKLKNMPSAKIMKKLRSLWNRQRFLTDD